MQSRFQPLLCQLLFLSSLAFPRVAPAAQPDIRWRAGGHFLGVQSLTFLPGQRLLSASSDLDVKLWDLSSRRLTWTSSDGRFGPSGVSVAPAGTFYVASAGEKDSNVITRQLSGEFLATRLGALFSEVSTTAISPSGQRAAAAGLLQTPAVNRDLRVWDVASVTEITTSTTGIPAGDGFFQRLEFLEEDELLIGSLDRLTRWSVEGDVRWTLPSPDLGSLNIRAVTADRSRILIHEESLGHPALLKLLDSATGETVWTLIGLALDFWRAGFTADGTQFVLSFSATAANAGSLEIRATSDGALLRTLPAPFQQTVPAFSPDGTLIACGHSQGIHLARLTGDVIWEPLTESFGAIRNVAVSPTQNWVAVTSDTSDLRLHRLDTGELFRTLNIGPRSHALATAPDGSWLAVITNSFHLVRYHPETDTFDTPSIETGVINEILVSADGSRLIALPSNGDSWMLNPATWAVTARPMGTSANLAAWAPDASRLTISFSSGLAQTYGKDLATPQFTRNWAEDRISFMEYLPDGETILSLHRSGKLRRWRVTEETILAESATGLTNATAVVLSPDQRLLLGAVRGDGIRVLKADSGAELEHWTRETGHQISKLLFSSDANWLVNARFDGVVVVSRAPFLLHSVQATPAVIQFAISGGTGPYQSQRHPTGLGAWTDVGAAFSGNAGAIPLDDSAAWLFRLSTIP